MLTKIKLESVQKRTRYLDLEGIGTVKYEKEKSNGVCMIIFQYGKQLLAEKMTRTMQNSFLLD